MDILNDRESCLLRYRIRDSEKIVVLEPKSPCFFLRRDNTSPQVFRYPELGGKTVMIVAGTAASADKQKRWNLPENFTCGTERQGIVIARGSVMATKRTLRGGIACKDKGADEKDFRMFALE